MGQHFLWFWPRPPRTYTWRARGRGSVILPLLPSSEHTANSFFGKTDWTVHWFSIYLKYLYKYLLKSYYAPGTMLALENTTVCSCHNKVNHLSQSVFMNFFQGSTTSLWDYSTVLQMASAGSWLCPHRPLQLLNSLSMSSPFKRQKVCALFHKHTLKDGRWKQCWYANIFQPIVRIPMPFPCWINVFGQPSPRHRM